MQADLVIRNARVVDHTGEFDGGIAVSNGKILMAGTDTSLPAAKRTVDAQGRCLMPGVVDTHCHLGVAYPFEQDMRTETSWARISPFTTSAGHKARPMPVSILDFISEFSEKTTFVRYHRSWNTPAFSRLSFISATSQTIQSESCRRMTVGYTRR